MGFWYQPFLSFTFVQDLIINLVLEEIENMQPF